MQPQVEKDGAFNKGDENRPVHITGTQEQVDAAEKLINDTVSQPSFRETEGMEEDTLQVSNSKVLLPHSAQPNSARESVRDSTPFYLCRRQRLSQG